MGKNNKDTNRNNKKTQEVAKHQQRIKQQTKAKKKSRNTIFQQETFEPLEILNQSDH